MLRQFFCHSRQKSVKSILVKDKKSSKEAQTGAKLQQGPRQMKVNITARISDEPLETRPCKSRLPDKLLTYLDAATSARGDILSLPFFVPFGSLDATSGLAAVIGLLIIIQFPDFDAQFFNINLIGIWCCQNLSDGIVKMRKHGCSVPCILYS